MTEVLSAAVGIAVVLGSVAAGAVWLRTSIVKQNHKELEQLVETRGNRIDDLESKVTELRNEVAMLRGELVAILEIKHTEIADAVHEKLLPYFVGTD